ncbi:Protein of unknown function [Bacillus mobilis]|nr:Protein of unknown function [Bacillus mobilis]
MGGLYKNYSLVVPFVIIRDIRNLLYSLRFFVEK